jgi:hypothetical protein
VVDPPDESLSGECSATEASAAADVLQAAVTVTSTVPDPSGELPLWGVPELSTSSQAATAPQETP